MCGTFHGDAVSEAGICSGDGQYDVGGDGGAFTQLLSHHDVELPGEMRHIGVA